MLKKIIIIFITLLIIIITGFVLVTNLKTNKQNSTTNNLTSNSSKNSTSDILPNNPTDNSSLANTSLILSPPIDNWSKRVTKKPFGIYVSPGHSPVSPERFTGYHTGVDFEIFSDEQNKDMTITAVCTGPLLLKESASGYGGVAVQACQLNNQDITVVYGHLKLSSITKIKGQPLTAGETIGILGKAYSSETDGERKHLHLGIHKGTAMNIKGYVQTPEQLNDWLDITKYLK